MLQNRSLYFSWQPRHLPLWPPPLTLIKRNILVEVSWKVLKKNFTQVEGERTEETGKEDGDGREREWGRQPAFETVR